MDTHAEGARRPSVELRQESGYRFSNRFAADMPPLFSDEPPPLGTGTGPSPAQLLAAAVGNCLAASLLFALKKFRQSPEPIAAEVTLTEGRNEQKRLRITGLAARLTLGVPAASLQNLDRALAQFEDFCTVTASVRAAIPVEVEVYDSSGARLK
ncbi:MAG TPA: OsmC family protein [Usitatibacter sp.]|nr:OsmC family protein [Usitatibacter sp.]